MTTKFRDDPASLEQIRAYWLKTEAAVKKPKIRKGAEVEIYWQISMSQMGLRLRRLHQFTDQHSEISDISILTTQLIKLEKEFDLCVEIGRFMFQKKPAHS
jgi:hypothetical protein